MTQDPLTQSHRTWAMLCHLSALAWIPLSILMGVIGLPIPLLLFNILIPLIVWWLKKNEHPFIDANGKECLNFQISLTLYSVIGFILILLLGGVTCGIGMVANNSVLFTIGMTLAVIMSVIVFVLSIAQLLFCSFAAFKAYQGEFYRYPYTIQFLR